MAGQERRRFQTVSDWHKFINELRESNAEVNLYNIRSQIYREIEEVRKRPLFVYATQFLDPPNQTRHLNINLTDVDGFTDLIYSVPENYEKIDILLHSPGGSPDATERIVNLIRKRFNNVTFLIPHSAYSAATMMALSGNLIILHPSATLGPIDPQINGTPARAFIRGFEKVRDLIQDKGPSIIPAYLPMLKQYSLHFLEQCRDAENLSITLAKNWITNYMFRDEEIDEKDVISLVNFLTDYDNHKLHSRPIYLDKLKEFKINVEEATGELKTLLRETHIVMNGFFELTPFVKVYENSSGLSYGRQVNSTLKEKNHQDQNEG
jgi:hypothetical protein